MGPPYGYPLPKIHKLSLQELSEKKIPPSRFVTDLSQGITARSDKFLIWKWLGPLATDYCNDLVNDSTHALRNLELLQLGGEVTNECYSFSLDVVSLYDSLKHDLVLQALEDAMDNCRPDWTYGFREWLKQLVLLSFKSAVVKYEDNWYVSVNGVPTGGITSVDLGNIAVFFVLRNLVYSKNLVPLKSFMRFVDDGLGLWKGDIDTFKIWFESLRQASIDCYGLDFTVEIHPVTEYHQFLDIQFKFENGSLQTDIYRKVTDANRYLEFSSFHPRHMFRSVVFSQGIRYRRIINDQQRLEFRLEELKSYFVKSSYPPVMVEEILNHILELPRNLEYNKSTDEKDTMTPWIVSFGPGYTEAQHKASDINDLIVRSDTWRNKPPHQIPKLKVVARRSPNLKDVLFKRRALALGPGRNATVPCTDANEKKKGTKCQCCRLVSCRSLVESNGVKVDCTGGNCKTRGLTYAATCQICMKVYVGKTVNSLRERVNGHRSVFYDVIKHTKSFYTSNKNDIDENQVLGLHLFVDHDKIERGDFNLSYKFDILRVCSPNRLRLNEQFYIDSLKTVIPYGLNIINSISAT